VDFLSLHQKRGRRARKPRLHAHRADGGGGDHRHHGKPGPCRQIVGTLFAREAACEIKAAQEIAPLVSETRGLRALGQGFAVLVR